MPETHVAPSARPYTGPGRGSAKPPTQPGPAGSALHAPACGATAQQPLSDWLDRCSDQPVAWLVVRLIHCKFYWLSISGEWRRSQRDAAAWREREEAYQAARVVSGLLYCYDRQ